jgi:hypothetical protein
MGGGSFMDTDNDLRQITKMVLDVFYSSTRREEIRLEIEYVDDIYNRLLELAYSDKQKDDIAKSKAFITGLNGTMIMPKTRDGVHYIVISKTYLDETLSFMGTIVHELTHIYDFIDFASEFCDGSYELIEQHDLFKIFYYWTEFNAKRNGYSYYRNIVYQNKNNNPSIEEEEVNYILNT